METWRVRRVANWVNLTTPLGLAVARVGRARLARAERGLWVASGFAYRFPPAGAFTVGSVVITRHDARWLAARPALLRHEERHAGQWAACLGLPFLPLYLAATAWSQWRYGDRATGNVFERRAGLEDGGYRRPAT